MRHFKLTISCLTLLVVFSACNSTKKIAGTYRSNFAIIGFFGTKINLKSDSTFSYRMRGDMMSDTANGKYKIRARFLILSYDPPTVDTTLYAKYGKEAVLISLVLQNTSSRPYQFYIGHNKLFEADTLGNIHKQEQGLSGHKKHIFWGQHYMKKRKYYLKRVD
jgi:hypothetical protein